MAGIIGYGGYVPFYRIKSAEIARVWGDDVRSIESGLGIKEKAVAYLDEDAATMAVEAARIALQRAGIKSSSIGALYVGSESHPYAVKPTATIVAEAIGATPNLTAADLEFACKAGTAGMQAIMGMVDAGMIEAGISIGSDTAQGRPGDALEYSAASGAAAMVIGKDKDAVAVIEDTFSYTTDTPDFWRRQGADYPSHGGRFTGEPAYFKHVVGATKGLLEKTGHKIADFDHIVFHQPNTKFPLGAAKKLGIPLEKLKTGLLVGYIGNTYSASSMLGLCAILDSSNPGQLILLTSFGSGAGSDSFLIKVTDKIDEKRNAAPLLTYYIEKKRYIDYATYVKYRRKLKT